MTIEQRLRHIFLTPDEPRLRAGWRIAAQFTLMLALTIVVACPMVVIMFAAPDAILLVSTLLGGIAVVISVLVARKWIDRRSIHSLGLQVRRRAAIDLLTGLGIGFIQIAFVFILQIAFGWLSVSGYAWQERSPLLVLGAILLGLLTHLAVGFYEELLSRGYHLQNLEEGINTFWAVALSSMVFGVAHLVNPNASWISSLGIVLAGVYLAFGYLRTRQLWLSIGLHIGWNFFLGPVFGFPVSGLATPGLLLLDVTGPEMITGGAFGPEAGLVVLPTLGLGVLLIWLYTCGRLNKEEQNEG